MKTAVSCNIFPNISSFIFYFWPISQWFLVHVFFFSLTILGLVSTPGCQIGTVEGMYILQFCRTHNFSLFPIK